MKRLAFVLLPALLAACGGGAAPAASSPAPASGAGASQAGTPAKPAAPAGAAASAKPAASGAAAKPAASAASTPIKIGLILPLTGPLSPSSKDNQSGFNAYLASINSTVAGRKIETVYADSEGKPDVGLGKAKQLVENEKVQLIAGLVATPVCYAIAPYIREAQVPLAVTADCGSQDLTTNPKFASPYISRFTETNNQQFAPPADWAYKQGYRKAIIMTSDFGAGIEISDAFSSLFIERGGTIVQEIHPALGTTDFGPFLAQLDKSADVLALFLPGTDGLRFGQQYPTYINKQKLAMIDMGAPITDSPNLPQLKDDALGITAVYNYSAAFDNPLNQSFVKAYQQAHNGQLPPNRYATGYANAEVVVAALQKINGNIEQKQQFLQAIDSTNAQTVKGPIKLDKYHDIVQNMYFYQLVKEGDHYAQKLVATYPEVDQFYGRTPEQSMRFPYGQLKGKWVNMTKAQLDKLTQSAPASTKP